MTDSDSYIRHYRTLGINSPCDRDALKKIYRKLANIWHPDRHTDNEQHKLLAEEKIKEINLAYKALSDYYRSNKKLPPYYSATKSAPPEQPDTTAARNNGSSATANSFSSDEDASHTNPIDETYQEYKRPSRFRRAVIFSFVVFTIYSAWKAFAPSLPNAIRNQAVSSTADPVIIENQITASSPDTTNDVNQAATKLYFTYGSNVGEVHAAQGTPARIEGDIWYYGKSEIHFSNGKVIYWLADLENPLNASSHHIATDKHRNFFTVGSTKNKVRRIQGKPDFVSENSWEYGMSKVYFSGDRVVKWYSSPLDPLKARK